MCRLSWDDARHIPSLAAAVILFLAGLADASADRLTLKNGSRLEGEVIAEDDATYTVQLATGTIKVRKSDVQRMERLPLPPPAREEKAPPPAPPPAAPPASAPRTPPPPTPPTQPPPAALEALWIRYFERKDLSPSDLSDALRKIGPEAIQASLDKARSQSQDDGFARGVTTFVEKTPSPDRAGALGALARAPFSLGVRESAIAALGHVGDVDSARMMVQLLKEESSNRFELYFTRALESLSLKPSRAAAAAGLVPILRDNRAQAIQPAAIAAYAALADPPDASLLRDLAGAANPETRIAVMVGLGRAEDRRSTSIISDALRSGPLPLQKAALYAAGRIRAWELAPQLIGLLEGVSDDRNFSRNVSDALCKITNQTYGPDAALWKGWWENNGKKLLDTGGELSRMLSGDAAERIQALQFIGANRCDLWLDAVGDTLATGPTAVRVEAARTMGRIRSPRGVPPLLRALSTTDAGVRDQAANALEQILGLSLGTDEVLWKAWWDALPEQRSGKTAGLVALMDHPDRKIRHAAVRKLGDYLVPESGAGLIRALRDEDTTVAEEACRVLGALHSQEAVPPLMSALTRENDALRSAAVSALRTITGQTWSTYDEWSQWWKKASR